MGAFPVSLGRGLNTRQEEAPRSSGEGSEGPQVQGPEPTGQECPCFLGDRARLRPPPGLDPPRSRAHASRSQAPPRRFPWLRRIRAFGNSQGRPLDPQALWWLSWGPGLGGGTLCGMHTHTLAQEMSALSPWSLVPDLCVIRSPWGHTTGLGVEGRRTPHPSHMAHWHLSLCFIPFPQQSHRPTEGAAERSWVRTEEEERQRPSEVRRHHSLPGASWVPGS